MRRQRHKKVSALASGDLKHQTESHVTATQKPGDIYPCWVLPPSYQEGFKIYLDASGVVVIKQRRIMEDEHSIELSKRELIDLMNLLPAVLRAANERWGT